MSSNGRLLVSYFRSCTLRRGRIHAGIDGNGGPVSLMVVTRPERLVVGLLIGVSVIGASACTPKLVGSAAVMRTDAGLPSGLLSVCGPGLDEVVLIERKGTGDVRLAAWRIIGPQTPGLLEWPLFGVSATSGVEGLGAPPDTPTSSTLILYGTSNSGEFRSGEVTFTLSQVAKLPHGSTIQVLNTETGVTYGVGPLTSFQTNACIGA